MIFVTLGTQDKGFERLLKAIDNEIIKGNIKEEVIVQAGYTKFNSDRMKIVDFVSNDEFTKLMSKASIVITHGGAGSILTAIKENKPVIAAARLKKYKEHTNDHQKQIIKEFSDMGYILELKDFNKLGKLIEKARKFKVKKFNSNTKNMVNLIENYIEEDNHISWFNKYKNNVIYILFCFLSFFVNILIIRTFYRHNIIGNNLFFMSSFLFELSVIIISYLSYFKSCKNKGSKFLFYSFIQLFLGICLFLDFKLINFNYFYKVTVSYIILFVLNYFICKMFTLEK